MKGFSSARNPWFLVILLVIGGMIGSLLGTAFRDLLPILDYGFPAIGLAPTSINLLVITITFGLILKLNLASVVGFIIALFVYFRL